MEAEACCSICNRVKFAASAAISASRILLSAAVKVARATGSTELATSILDAANSQNFRIDSRKVLGRIQEGQKIAHIVARLSMQQNSESTSDVFVYTLVKEGDNWKLTFPPTIRQVLTVIEAQAKQLR